MKIKNTKKIILINSCKKILPYFFVMLFIFLINLNTTSAQTQVQTTLLGDSISEAKTYPAINIKEKSLTFQGSMNPGGIRAKAYFRYSTVSPQKITPVFCNDIYGSDMKSTNEIILGENGENESQLFYTTATDLAPNTTYFYCTVGSNNNQIEYGGVLAATTSGVPSVRTEKALVANETVAYLNGFFNSNVSADTWFEYRKNSVIQPNNQQTLNTKTNSPKKLLTFIKNGLDSFFKINKAIAQTNTGNWIKVGLENHPLNTNQSSLSGNMKYTLSGLTSGTNYEFKAVIKATIGTEVHEGETLNFTTKGPAGTSGDPLPPGGVGYFDPCANLDDINCNGTGGNIIPPGGTGTTRPDLIANKTTPAFIAVNTPANLISLIKNQGDSSTLIGFYNFFQISLIKPAPGGAGTGTPAGGASSFNFFKTEKAFAAGETNAASAMINLPSILVPALNARASTTITQAYVFNTVGTYYVRACADKKTPGDIGLITEGYEGNNCSPWNTLTVNLTGTGGGGNGGGGSGGGTGTGGGTGGSGTGTGGGISPLVLGQTATPPELALVGYHEGIETVLQRQIVANTELAKTYGYEEGGDLQSFGWYLSDIFARTFGYVNTSGKEIRVIQPDIAAYQIDLSNGILTIYEYYDSKIVNIQKMTPSLRSIYDYEYYFRK